MHRPQAKLQGDTAPNPLISLVTYETAQRKLVRAGDICQIVYMSAPLARMIYFSVPTTPPHLVIFDIIRVSEARNLKLSCSGLLAYGGQGYMQIIEGPEAGVSALRTSILRDPRHKVQHHIMQGVETRLVTAELPMGYLSMDNEGLVLGLRPETYAGADVEALLVAGHKKYPSAVRSAQAGNEAGSS